MWAVDNVRAASQHMCAVPKGIKAVRMSYMTHTRVNPILIGEAKEPRRGRNWSTLWSRSGTNAMRLEPGTQPGVEMRELYRLMARSKMKSAEVKSWHKTGWWSSVETWSGVGRRQMT
jgi:hypothetical protein